MKTLLLMRHAKSSWDNPQQDDHDRPLNARGLRDAPRMAACMMQHGRTPDSITCSTAARAEHTARLVAAACQLQTPVRTTPTLYHADIDAWCSVVRNLPAESGCALCVGHNPGIETLVFSLTGEPQHMSTAAVAVLDLPLDDWSKFDPSKPLQHWTLWRPKELDD